MEILKPVDAAITTKTGRPKGRPKKKTSFQSIIDAPSINSDEQRFVEPVDASNITQVRDYMDSNQSEFVQTTMCPDTIQETIEELFGPETTTPPYDLVAEQERLFGQFRPETDPAACSSKDLFQAPEPNMENVEKAASGEGMHFEKDAKPDEQAEKNTVQEREKTRKDKNLFLPPTRPKKKAAITKK